MENYFIAKVAWNAVHEYQEAINEGSEKKESAKAWGSLTDKEISAYMDAVATCRRTSRTPYDQASTTNSKVKRRIFHTIVWTLKDL